MVHEKMTREQLIQEIDIYRERLEELTGKVQQSDEYKQKYIELIQESLDGYAMLDIDGNIIFCNEVYLQILGHSFEELKKLTYKEITPEIYHEIDQTQFNKMFERGFSDLYEKEYIKGDGSLIPIEIRSYIIKDANGDFSGTWSYVRDLSQRKQDEDALRRMQEQLLQAQKMESVGRLAGGIAHDFNNMLSVITGYSELALDILDPDEPVYDHLTEIHGAAKRSARITNQLLAFARKQTVKPKVIDLNDAVEHSLKMLRRLIGEHLDLLWHPRVGVWPIKIDPGQIDQILANLCVNARDSISDTGKITIETDRKIFDEDYCKGHVDCIPGDYVQLAVSDNGCGIEPELLENIFEPFFTTKEQGVGTGLGLATVYGIIKQNNGFVSVYSEQDEGTTFRLYFPRHRKEPIEKIRPATKKVSKGHGEIILLVEDERSILELTEKFLKTINYRVLAAASPLEALRLAEAHSGEISLLLTDVIMPGMSGGKLAERLQTNDPKLKCIFMSGYTADVISNHGVLDERINFVQKPFSMKELAAKIRAVLD